MSSNFTNYYTLNNEHNQEDLCIQLMNRKNMHFQIRRGIIFNPIFDE